jgi:hypothetical protein
MAAAIWVQLLCVAPAAPVGAETAGAGKSSTLEGTRGRETWGTTDGDGLVHLAVDELFGLVHGKAVTVGEWCWQQQQHFVWQDQQGSRCGCRNTSVWQLLEHDWAANDSLMPGSL